MRRILIVTGVAAAIILLYAAVVRPYHMHWGATPAEQAMALPGDSFILPNSAPSTRAITIHAPVASVWPWLVQLGQGRGGFYSHDWLENLFAANMRNVDTIVPGLQQIAVGDKISLQEGGIALDVVLVEPERALVLRGWGMYLEPVTDDTTRLIVRYADFSVDSPLAAFYYHGILEPAHFIMEAGMMLGIKQRAEQQTSASDTL